MQQHILGMSTSRCSLFRCGVPDASATGSLLPNGMMAATDCAQAARELTENNLQQASSKNGKDATNPLNPGACVASLGGLACDEEDAIRGMSRSPTSGECQQHDGSCGTDDGNDCGNDDATSSQGGQPRLSVNTDAANEQVISPDLGLSGREIGAETLTNTDSADTRSDCLERAVMSDPRLNVMGRKAELEELRQKRLAQILRKELSQAALLYTQQSPDDQTSQSQHYFSPSSSEENGYSPRFPFPSHQTSFLSQQRGMTELDSFFMKQKAMDDELRRQRRESIESLHRYKNNHVIYSPTNGATRYQTGSKSDAGTRVSTGSPTANQVLSSVDEHGTFMPQDPPTYEQSKSFGSENVVSVQQASSEASGSAFPALSFQRTSDPERCLFSNGANKENVHFHASPLGHALDAKAMSRENEGSSRSCPTSEEEDRMQRWRRTERSRYGDEEVFKRDIIDLARKAVEKELFGIASVCKEKSTEPIVSSSGETLSTYGEKEKERERVYQEVISVAEEQMHSNEENLLKRDTLSVVCNNGPRSSQDSTAFDGETKEIGYTPQEAARTVREESQSMPKNHGSESVAMEGEKNVSATSGEKDELASRVESSIVEQKNGVTDREAQNQVEFEETKLSFVEESRLLAAEAIWLAKEESERRSACKKESRQSSETDYFEAKRAIEEEARRLAAEEEIKLAAEQSTLETDAGQTILRQSCNADEPALLLGQDKSLCLEDEQRNQDVKLEESRLKALEKIQAHQIAAEKVKHAVERSKQDLKLEARLQKLEKMEAHRIAVGKEERAAEQRKQDLKSEEARLKNLERMEAHRIAAEKAKRAAEEENRRKAEYEEAIRALAAEASRLAAEEEESIAEQSSIENSVKLPKNESPDLSEYEGTKHARSVTPASRSSRRKEHPNLPVANKSAPERSASPAPRVVKSVRRSNTPILKKSHRARSISPAPRAVQSLEHSQFKPAKGRYRARSSSPATREFKHNLQCGRHSFPSDETFPPRRQPQRDSIAKDENSVSGSISITEGHVRFALLPDAESQEEKPSSARRIGKPLSVSKSPSKAPLSENNQACSTRSPRQRSVSLPRSPRHSIGGNASVCSATINSATPTVCSVTSNRKSVLLYNGRSLEKGKKCDRKPCPLKWQPNLHKSRAGCERCLHFASEQERKEFSANGRHVRINLVRGGCARSCSFFPRRKDESPVRLCHKCFYDTHELKLW